MKTNECSCGCGDSNHMNGKEEMTENYMFAGNVQTIKRLIEIIEEMDPKAVDEIIHNGHDWAEDHISSAKDDIEEVADFLMNKMGMTKSHPAAHGKMIGIKMPFVHTFESFVSESMKKEYGDPITKEEFAKLKGKTIVYSGMKYKVKEADEYAITCEGENGKEKKINLNMFNSHGAITK